MAERRFGDLIETDLDDVAGKDYAREAAEVGMTVKDYCAMMGVPEPNATPMAPPAPKHGTPGSDSSNQKGGLLLNLPGKSVGERSNSRESPQRDEPSMRNRDRARAEFGFEFDNASNSSKESPNMHRSASYDHGHGYGSASPGNSRSTSKDISRSASKDIGGSFYDSGPQPSISRGSAQASAAPTLSNLTGGAHYSRTERESASYDRDRGSSYDRDRGLGSGVHGTGSLGSGVHGTGSLGGRDYGGTNSLNFGGTGSSTSLRAGLGLERPGHGHEERRTRSSTTMGMGSAALKSGASSYAKEMGLQRIEEERRRESTQDRLKEAREREERDYELFLQGESELMRQERLREEKLEQRRREKELFRWQLMNESVREELLKKGGIRIFVKKITNSVKSESGQTTIGLADRTLGPILVLPQESIYDLKIRIYDELGWAPKNQRLVHQGEELEDEWLISREANIKQEDQFWEPSADLKDQSIVLLQRVTEVDVGCGLTPDCVVS